MANNISCRRTESPSNFLCFSYFYYMNWHPNEFYDIFFYHFTSLCESTIHSNLRIWLWIQMTYAYKRMKCLVAINFQCVPEQTIRFTVAAAFDLLCLECSVCYISNILYSIEIYWRGGQHILGQVGSLKALLWYLLASWF